MPNSTSNDWFEPLTFTDDDPEPTPEPTAESVRDAAQQFRDLLADAPRPRPTRPRRVRRSSVLTTGAEVELTDVPGSEDAVGQYRGTTATVQRLERHDDDGTPRYTVRAHDGRILFGVQADMPEGYVEPQPVELGDRVRLTAMHDRYVCTRLLGVTAVCLSSLDDYYGYQRHNRNLRIIVDGPTQEALPDRYAGTTELYWYERNMERLPDEEQVNLGTDSPVAGDWVRMLDVPDDYGADLAGRCGVYIRRMRRPIVGSRQERRGCNHVVLVDGWGQLYVTRLELAERGTQ